MNVTRLGSNDAGQYCADIQKLLLQLPDQKDLTQETLSRVLDNSNTIIVGIIDEGHIVGMGGVYIEDQLERRRGHVEEVVVDEAYRGRGLGNQLMRGLLDEAKKNGLVELELTSRPSNVTANAWYQKLGFEKRETNVYRMKL